MIFFKIFKAFIIVIFTLAENVKPYILFLLNNIYFFFFSTLLIIFMFIFLYYLYIILSNILRFLSKKFNIYNTKYFNININNINKIKVASITIAPGLLVIIGADSLIDTDFANTINIIGPHVSGVINLITGYASTLDIELPKPSVSGKGV